MPNQPTSTSYAAPAWLPGGNLQTIYSATLAAKPKLFYRRERWDTPDGDFIDLDWMDGDPASALYVLFHGLEGDSSSHYAVSLMAQLRARGQTGVVVHFRGCSGEMNWMPRAYHSGDSPEIDWILRRFKSLRPATPIHATGISLGGNALLKWLGEQGEAAQPILHSAAAVGAPMDLMASGLNLQRGFNMVYTRMFLATLKRKSLRTLARYPGLFDVDTMRRSCNLYEFDNVVTGPLHGYRDTNDYWTRGSSKPVLKNIALPTLIINARNDPFIPPESLPCAADISRHVTLEYPATGGHVGFVTGPFPGYLHWLPERLLHHFNSTHSSTRERDPRIVPATGYQPAIVN